MKEPWDFVDDVRRATSIEGIEAVASKYAKATGFGHYGFAIKSKNTVAPRSYYKYFHNIPEPWGRYRYEETYPGDAADRDPLISHLRLGLPATAFSATGVVSHTRPDIVHRAKKILQGASSHGVKSGIFVPLQATSRSWSFMIMTTPDTSDVRDVLPALPNFHFFAHHLHSVVKLALQPPMQKIVLTHREREILCWTAVGKTSWEVGCILGLAECTINYHLQKAAKKLSVSGRRAACSKALMLGLIVP